MVTLSKTVLYATLNKYCRMHSIECCYAERHYAEYRTFNVILSAIMCKSDCRYAECHFAECDYAECHNAQ
jgi:hypothetical protein